VQKTRPEDKFMEINAKSVKEQSLRELVSSLELISARLLDSITTASQLASANTPEMRNLFAQWVTIIGNEILRTADSEGIINPYDTADRIGITPETALSLCLTLHRQGKIKITALNVEHGDGKNKDICDCLS